MPTNVIDDPEKGPPTATGKGSSGFGCFWGPFSRLRPRGENADRADDNEATYDDDYTEAENLDASSKMWSVYVGEAERYDKRLVESWKGDMDGMLIFSGLYSASLTAFLVESYKTLQRDSGDAAVTLLAQISQQLSAASAGTPEALLPPDPFEPTTAALICNTLWFLSLALSLTCALLATLVEQWAREFLHKTDLRPAPVQRARVFSFLYFGLRRFRMHTIVDVIPLLLHASLFLFFAGLVGFLLPVNHFLVFIVGSVLAIFSLLYIVITVLPILFLDSPYRTPLSNMLWRLWRPCRALIDAQVSHTFAGSWTDSMISQSVKDTDERDKRAVEWTVTSLTDDAELLPFVESIPEAIYGPKGFRHANLKLFLHIVSSDDNRLSIGTRVVNLLCRTKNLTLDDVLRTTRQNTCLKAIWSLAMSPLHNTHAIFDINESLSEAINLYPTSGLHEVDPYHAVAAGVAIEYSVLANSRRCIEMAAKYLERCDVSSESLQVVRNMLDAITREHVLEHFSAHYVASPFRILKQYLDVDITTPNTMSVLERLQGIQIAVTELSGNDNWAADRLNLLADFLSWSFRYKLCPYEFSATCDIMMEGISLRLCSGIAGVVGASLYSDHISSATVSSGTDIGDIDRLVNISFRLFPFVDNSREALPGIYRYISDRGDHGAVRFLISACDMEHLSSCILDDLSDTDKPSDWSLKTVGILCEPGFSEESRHESWLGQFAKDLFPLLCRLKRENSSSYIGLQSIVSSVSRLMLKDLFHQAGLLVPKTPPETRQMGTTAHTYEHAEADLNVILSELNDIIAAHPVLHTVFGDQITLSTNSGFLEACKILSNQIYQADFALQLQFLIACGDVPQNPLHYDFAQFPDWALDQHLVYTRFEGPTSTDIQRWFADGVLVLVQRLRVPGTKQKDVGLVELRSLLDEIWRFSNDWKWIDDVECVSTMIEAINLYLQLNGIDKGREYDRDSPISGARRLLARCYDVAKSQDIGGQPSTLLLNRHTSSNVHLNILSQRVLESSRADMSYILDRGETAPPPHDTNASPSIF